MYLYIFIEIVYLILILINFVIKKYSNILNIGPIIISLFYTLINNKKVKKEELYLILSLIFSLAGDTFFILLDKHTLGVASFIIVQMFYLFFIKGKLTKLGLIILLNFIICTIFDNKILIMEVIFYAVMFIINIILTIKSVKNKKTPFLFLVALFSLLICDINIAIINKINLSTLLNIICNCIEWISYTSNLILITLIANGLIKVKNDSNNS